MTREELEEEYFWEIKNFHEGTFSLLDIMDMLYRAGYYDGLTDAKDREYG